MGRVSHTAHAAFALAWRKWARCMAGVLACVLLPVASVPASDFPKSQPIRIIVPAPPGGSIDVVSRIIANEMMKNMRHSVIVENRPGARSLIAANAVSKSDPDGHTLLAMSTSLAMTQAITHGRLYDLTQDFSPITLIASGPLLMAVRRDLPVDNVADIVKLAKTKPGDLKFGSGGVGTSMHLTAVLFANSFGVEMQHIPFQGSGPALNSLMGGHIDILFDPVVTLQSQATSGAVKALAITGKSRSASLPGVPTVAESGAPGFDVEGWFALLAAANTPPDVTNVLHQEVVKALAGEDVRARLNTMGVRPIGSSPAEFAQFLRAEVDRWARVVADAKIKEE